MSFCVGSKLHQCLLASIYSNICSILFSNNVDVYVYIYVCVYYIYIYFQATTNAGRGSSTVSVVLSAASCYDAYATIPATAKPGMYTLHLDNGLGSNAKAAAAAVVPVEIIAPNAWPTKVFKVAVGDDVSKALATAAAAGGGVVLLASGKHAVADGLCLGDGVQLVGASASSSTSVPAPSSASSASSASSSISPPAVLSFDVTPATAGKPLFSLSNATSKTDRYALRNLVVDVNVAVSSYVIDVGGHGVEIEGVVVTMPTETGKQLPSVPSTLHMYADLRSFFPFFSFKMYSTDCSFCFLFASFCFLATVLAPC